MKKTVYTLFLVTMFQACDAQITVDEATMVSEENAIHTNIKPESCVCSDEDGKAVWKFSIKEKDLDGHECQVELYRGDRKIISKSIRKFLGGKFDRDDLKIETKEFRNRLAVTVTLYGVEIPESKEADRLVFKIDGKEYSVKAREFELVNGKWRRETNRNDTDPGCQ